MARYCDNCNVELTSENYGGAVTPYARAKTVYCRRCYDSIPEPTPDWGLTFIFIVVPAIGVLILGVVVVIGLFGWLLETVLG